MQFLDELCRAKSLYMQERFASSKELFRSIGRRSRAAAPAIYVEAEYLLADCYRLERRFAEAYEHYVHVLELVPLWHDREGPLAESNGLVCVGAVLGLASIERLSLRRDAQSVRELLSSGRAWARSEHDDLEPSLFELEQTLLERNVCGTRRAIDGLGALHTALEWAWSRGEGRLDLDVAALRGVEMRLDLGLPLGDEVQPIVCDAARWSRVMWQILCVEDALARGDGGEAARGLRAFEGSKDRELYPELALRAAQLALRLAWTTSVDMGENEERLVDLEHALERGLREVADLSTPLWAMTRLARTLLFDPSCRAAGGLRDRVAGALLDALGTDWLVVALLSRRVTEEALTDVRVRLRLGRRESVATGREQESFFELEESVHP